MTTDQDLLEAVRIIAANARRMNPKSEAATIIDELAERYEELRFRMDSLEK